jgi:outer membrane protein assembly factor BamD (BamD/ComL family)
MRRAFFALGLSLALVSPSFAQLASPLELVRALRQAGMVDLAVLRLDELKAKPELIGPEDAALLPLELARIRLEEAARETEEARRATLIGQARASFDEFIKTNPTHPMSAQARVEMARLTALQAKGQLSRGNRQEGKDAKALEFSRARPDFTAAINLYKGAITNLDNRLKNLDEKNPLSAELKRSKAQAELDAAVLQVELAQTYVGEDESKQKGEALDKAQKEFEALATKYANQRVGYLAQVWAWQCLFMLGDPAKSIPNIEKFATTNRQNREAADAVRLAGFFGIDHAFEETGKDTSMQARLVRTEQSALRWLQMYPEAKNTPEGLGARYRRALMKEQQAFLPGGVRFEEPPKVAPKAAPKTAPPPPPKAKPAEKGKEPAKEPAKESAKEPEPEEKEAAPVIRRVIGISPQAKQLLEDANKIYKELTDTDNEYSERAHRHRLINQVVILDGEGKGGDPQLKSINTLEQGFLAAQVQQARIYESNNNPKTTEDQKDKEEKRRTKAAISYLERGLQSATAKDPVRDVFDAQMLLVQMLTKDDRAVEAAVLGEGLARSNPKMSKAALAAVLGVYAYNTAIGKAKAAGLGEDAENADLQRLKTLANFTIVTWPNDGPTDAARHVLGYFLSNREKDYETAWKTYAGIGNGYPDIAQARREMAGTMFYLIRPEEKDPKKYREVLQKNITDRAKQFQTTISALESLTEPSPGSPGPAVESWAGAKTMQAQLYYMASDYDKVDATVKQVTDTLKKIVADAKGGIEGKKKADLEYTIRALKFNALQGRAADFIRAKEFAKVGDSLGGELEALKKELATPPTEETPGLTRLKRAQRDFLIACMSAFLQNKQGDKASELLDTLQGAGGTVEQNVAVMQQLVSTIRGQIDGLVKENKKADADELARGFSEFLDKIKGDDLTKLSKNVAIFLGQGYGAVDQHAKSAELFAALLAKTDPEKEQGTYRQLEFMQARAFRQAGQFPQATALMQKIVGDPIKKGAPQGWGYKNLAMRKEYCMLLEDQLFFGPAGNNWQVMTREFVVGGLPVPVKFLGARPAFVGVGQGLDELMAAHCMFPTGVSPFLDAGFKSVFSAAAENRNRLRLVYFDLFYETLRCSARAYTTPSIVAKVKGGQPAADQKLADLGEKFFQLVSKNEDVQPEVKEKIKDLLDKTPAMKKKFDELAAAAPAPPKS